MGFRLPIIGYVGPRSAGANLNPKGKKNIQDIYMIDAIINRVHDAYNRPDGPSSQFNRGNRVDPDKLFLGTHLELKAHQRPTLHRVLLSLPEGGTIVTPDLIHVSRAVDESRALMRMHLDVMVGFIFTDVRNDYHFQTEYDIKSAIRHLMDSRYRVDASLIQDDKIRS